MGKPQDSPGNILNENPCQEQKNGDESLNATLRLNLSLSPVLLLDEEFPIYVGYYLNIDPVSDPDGDMVYPLNISALGACGTETATVEGLCSEGTDADLTALGALVLRLDDAGTTVGDMLTAADLLLLSGDDDILVNRVTLSRGDTTEILSLINESYDEGIPTAFVTAFDAD